MHSKKVLGKNPPPKLAVNRPKGVASIPSNTVAPPEDKTMTMSTFVAGVDQMQNTEQTSGFRFKGPKKHDYLASIEKANNPNVGPGSYDPMKPKLQTTMNTDWSRQPGRFKNEQSDRDEMMDASY